MNVTLVVLVLVLVASLLANRENWGGAKEEAGLLVLCILLLVNLHSPNFSLLASKISIRYPGRFC
jgi:hypothetical protein